MLGMALLLNKRCSKSQRNTREGVEFIDIKLFRFPSELQVFEIPDEFPVTRKEIILDLCEAWAWGLASTEL